MEGKTMSRFRIDGDAVLSQKIFDSFSLDPTEAASEALHSYDAAAKRLSGLLASKDPDVLDCMESYNDEFMPRFVFHSTAMEGSTLTLLDTELVLEGEFLPSSKKELEDLFSVKVSHEGYQFAMQEIYTGRPFDEEFIKDIHGLTALDIQPRNRGTYRAVPVYIANSLTVPASPDSLRCLMKDLFSAYGAANAHPLVKAAAFHAMFENIHPFRDGNGRTGRIVLNAMLVQEGYPPIAIKHENKDRYAQSLQSWQVHGDPEPLLSMIGECVMREAGQRAEAAEMTIKLLPTVAKERQEREGRAPAATSNGLADVQRVKKFVQQGFVPRPPDFGSKASEIARQLRSGGR